MVVTTCDIPGLLVFEPKVFEDSRGFFLESFNEKDFQEILGEKIVFCQDNESMSKKNVLRGLHFQTPPFAQGKLVRVISGSVIDVVVDIRTSSPYYGKYQLIELSAKNKKQFWIPPGFAHGFLSLEENTIFNYKCTNYYSPVSEKTIKWNDLDLQIKWPNMDPIVSEKDQVGLEFANFVSEFD